MSPRRYLQNCFLLVAPALVVNVVWGGRLPAMWQYDEFWKEIPSVVAYGERITSVLVNVLPMLMPLRLASRGHRIGVAMYALGFLVYFGSWAHMVYRPESAWSRHVVVATAPAWTSVLWLVGIGWVGDSLNLRLPYRPWVFVVLSLAFGAFHTLHAVLVFQRLG